MTEKGLRNIARTHSCEDANSKVKGFHFMFIHFMNILNHYLTETLDGSFQQLLKQHVVTVSKPTEDTLRGSEES